MCEMLGTEASEDQLPMELEDLLRETRVALKIHSSLKDTWEGMNGVYLGKSLQGLDTLFSIYRVDTASYKIVSENRDKICRTLYEKYSFYNALDNILEKRPLPVLAK